MLAGWLAGAYNTERYSTEINRRRFVTGIVARTAAYLSLSLSLFSSLVREEWRSGVIPSTAVSGREDNFNDN